MKPIVIITIGISGSGKSTFAKEQCRINPNTIRLNRDDMRANIFGVTLQDYFNNWKDHKQDESLITSLTWKLANQAVKEGNNVILDNTHLDIRYIKDILKNIDEDCEFQIEWFLIDPETCIERDSQRETVVGEKVIKQQYDKFLTLFQKQSEINQLIEDRKKLNFEPVIRNPYLPDAVIFDIDGTLAKMVDRSPFDWGRVDEDKVNEPVWDLAHFIEMYQLNCDRYINTIICTGRDGKAEEKTREWLVNHDIAYDDFYIRKSGDCRKDSIVKREFLEDIVTKYNVLFAVDDRSQVVKMWRRSGIPCFQVDEGDF